MSNCPKCGSPNISGPRYNKDALGRERLLYRCVRCGYEESTPTNDATASKEAPPHG